MGIEKQVLLPDIGDFEDVDVAEVLVAVGDRVEAEDPLIVLESDKATMEIPAPAGGVVRELRVAVGDRVSEGDVIAVLDLEGDEAKPEAAAHGTPPAAPVETPVPSPAPAAPVETPVPSPAPAALAETPVPSPAPAAPAEPARRSTPPRRTEPAAASPVPVYGGGEPEATEAPRTHASPSVRRLARELGVDLALVPATGRKGRILEEDVRAYVKSALAQGTGTGVPIAGVHVVKAPEIDFSRFGPTELQPLNRIRRLSSANLHRSWVTVPHVTQFDEADITELDAFRKQQKPEAERRGVKLTFLPFLIKACTRALAEFPHFNASLDPSGESLVVKKYCHVGVAVETENGLVVPVVRDADRKGLFELAAELQDLSERARSRKLRPDDLQGGSFSISSLGGIGGTFFTPIVNHPEVAILGVSRMEWKPVFQPGDAGFAPRLILPLSLSYDHRVIDGADAVRFTRRLAELLTDLRLLLL